MKTIEEKAERYDEALEELRGLLEGIREEKREILEEDITSIFPELEESEDEKIRKSLIDMLKNDEKCYIKEITWLEKQGGKDKLIRELGEYKVKYTQEVLEKRIDNMNNKDAERLRNTTIAFLKDFADKGYENAIECIDWLEKQGEQKPQGKSALEATNEEKVDNINKVKTKFNKVKTKFQKIIAEQEFGLHSYSPRIKNILMSNGVDPDKTIADMTAEQFYKLLLIFNHNENIK
jgi:hypothetical protein